MALGFAQALLFHLKTLMEQNYPGVKITPAGFTKMLVENNPSLRVASINGQSIDGLKRSTASGHIRDVKLKYLPPITPSQISSEDNCENDFGFQYSEMSLETPLFSKGGFRVEWGFVERYQDEASRLVSTGNPQVTILQEMMEQIMHTCRGLVGDMNSKLVQSATFGTNITGGSPKVININKDGSALDLASGVTELISDAMENEIVGDLLTVGGGLFNKYNIAKNNLGINSAGLNQGAMNGYVHYFDPIAGSKWGGSDYVGAFAKGAVGLVDIDRYIAWKTGRHGTSEFAQIMLPIENGASPLMMNFNLQIKEIDCPDEDFDGYETRPMGRGYQILISKNYGLFQAPKTAYQASDRLSGNNGALLYDFTNKCDGCEGGLVEVFPPQLR